MTRAGLVLLATLLLAGCGGAKSPATTATTHHGPAPRLQNAVSRTLAAGSAHFDQATGATVGGTPVQAHGSGTIDFRRRRAHIYRVSPGQQVPEEIVVDGPVTYTNANVQASLNDSSVKPWTRLDTRRLTARERLNQADEVAHALAPLFLAAGIAHPVLLRSSGTRTVYRGQVDPARLLRLPLLAAHAEILKSIRADYPNRPFRATFTLDANGRLRRVAVAYRSEQGTPFSIDTAYSSFGTPVDLTVPPAREIKDITPR